MSCRLQLDVCNLSLGRHHLVNAYEVKAGSGVIAGKTVWSMRERLSVRYCDPCVSVWVWGTVIHAWAFECEVLWSMRERLSVRYCDPCVSVWVWGTPALQNTQTFNLLNYWFVLVQFCLFGYDAMIYKIAKPQHHKSCDLCAFNCDYTASQKKKQLWWPEKTPL